jgi:hypothetical protein
MISKQERKIKMRENSIRDALRRHNMDDSPTQDGIDEIDLITGKVRDWSLNINMENNEIPDLAELIIIFMIIAIIVLLIVGVFVI